ncbi:MAG: hypothetical protein WAX33_04905 [Rectinemataceae bacterium]
MDSREKFLTVKTGGPSASFEMLEMPELIPLAVAAHELGVHPRTLCNYAKMGRIGLVKLSSRKFYVYKKEILTLLDHSYKISNETTVEQ